LSSPEAVVFDLDGTLLDSAPDIHRSLNVVLQSKQIPSLELQEVLLMIGGGPEVLIRKALDSSGTVSTPEEVGQLTESFERAYFEQESELSSLFDGARECIDYLAQHNIPIGLCSNKPEHICIQLLSDLGIDKFFGALQGSGSGLPRKPDPAPLLAVLGKLKARPSQAIYVGDSKTDVDTARAAGVPVALVTGGYTDTPAAALGADWVVESLTDLPSIWK
jgi:phosphoglycolate phosphatase